MNTANHHVNGTTDEGFAGAVICVAGASRGIGQAISQEFLGSGANLVLLSRSADAGPANENRVLSMPCDVSQYREVEHAVDQAIQKWGRIDVLVNTAGVLGATGPIWTTDPSEWASAIQINLIGTYHTMRAILPFMINARRGKIVNFAGGGAAYGYPLFSGYAASKAAVVRLTETVASEVAEHNIQVNVIAPGAIDTEMLRAVRAAGGEVRSVGVMSQPLALVKYLASKQSDHLSGRFIHAKDDYRSWSSLGEDSYTLRRVQPS